MTTVPRLWPNSTVVLLGGGPSLTREDVDACRGRCPVIAINSSYKIAPFADVLYACDARWWGWEKGAPTFAGLKYSIDPAAAKWPGVQVLANAGYLGLELDPTGLRTGKNSGYQSINLAVHLGATRMVLLGFDMGPSPDGREYWHEPHPENRLSPYPQMVEAFASLVEPLAELGVSVVNCSRRTALTTFPRAALEYELALLRVQESMERFFIEGSSPLQTPVGITR
jgi:hypothetical protein